MKNFLTISVSVVLILDAVYAISEKVWKIDWLN